MADPRELYIHDWREERLHVGLDDAYASAVAWQKANPALGKSLILHHDIRPKNSRTRNIDFGRTFDMDAINKGLGELARHLNRSELYRRTQRLTRQGLSESEAPTLGRGTDI